ncbi:MAG: ATP-binding protein, partial [Halanaerobiaceae bacterium]
MRELSLHILDIMENSIEAGGSFIKLTIIEDIAGNSLIIKIEDDGRGMNEKEQRDAVKPFWTTRTTRDVGLGIPLFKEASRQCNGDFKLKSSPGKGTEITAEFEYDHIDRAPLGNIPATISGFIAANPDLDFKYKHIYNDKIFLFSTEAIKKE